MKCSERLSIMKALCQPWPALMACVFMLAGTLNLSGAEDEPVTLAPSVTAPRMDYGSMLTYTVGLPATPGKTNENLAGMVEYTSREGVTAQRPQLLLTFTPGPGGGNPPTIRERRRVALRSTRPT